MRETSSTNHHFSYPKVEEIVRATRGDTPAPRRASQRELILASLLRHPDRPSDVPR